MSIYSLDMPKVLRDWISSKILYGQSWFRANMNNYSVEDFLEVVNYAKSKRFNKEAQSYYKEWYNKKIKSQLISLWIEE